MLINRVDVVGIILHLRNDPPEIRQEAAKNTAFIHPAQCLFRITGRRQYLHEQTAGLFIAAQLAIHQLEVLVDGLQRVRVDIQPVLFGNIEEADDIHRLFPQRRIILNRQPVTIQPETGDFL